MIRINMNKYRNKWTMCNQGHKHQSKKEALYCNDLELLKKAGEIITYEIQKTYLLYAVTPDWYSKIIGEIIIDFEVLNKNYKKEIHEVKNKNTKTQLYKLKKKIFEVNYPDIIFKEII